MNTATTVLVSAYGNREEARRILEGSIEKYKTCPGKDKASVQARIAQYEHALTMI